MLCCFEEVVEEDLTHGVHLAGIGGVGMTALAEILLDLGIPVSGSDTTCSKNVLMLRSRGVKIYPSHKKEQVGEKLLCRTRAVKDDNEEVLAAKKVVYRSTLLAFFAKNKKQIVVTGAHGKTSVSALLSHCMMECGFDISFAVGGWSKSLGRYGKISSGEYFILEGDESDGSHLKTNPYAAILTSCDVDHLAFWKEGSKLQDSYIEFAKKVETKKHFVFHGDDPFLALHKVEGIPYGEGEYRADNIELEVGASSFSLREERVHLPMFGVYNIQNAIAVIALLESFDVPFEKIKRALATFKGVMRRMEYLGENIYSDYAHHPREVEEVLKSVEKFSEEVAVVFEPHRLSRFQDEMEEFVKVFPPVVITDVFEASEDTGVDSKPLLKEFCERTGSIYVPLNEVKQYLQKEKKKVLALSAGSLDKKLREFVDEV